MNLTLRAYALVILITALGILGQWLPAAISPLWWKLFACLAILLLLTEYLYARRWQPQLALLAPEQAKLGRDEQLLLTLHNPRDHAQRLAVYLPPTPGELRSARIDTLTLGPAGRQTLTLDFIPCLLQPLAWQRAQLSQRGRFGLAWWGHRPRLQATTRVVPDSLGHSGERRLGNRQVGHRHRRQLAASGLELQGLRPYQAGDPLHAIDWKATARSRQLKTRLFEEDQHLELLIAIDAGRTSGLAAGRLTRLGHYCNIAARLAERAMLHGDTIGLLVYAEDLKSCQTGLRGHGGLQRLRQTLEQLRPSGQDANPLHAVMRIRALAQQRALVLFLSDVDDGYAARQLNQSLRLLTPKHLPLLAGITEQAVLDIHAAQPQRWLDPYRLLSANELILNWRQLRVEMAQMGIPVVTQPAERLDAEVLQTYEQLVLQRRV